MINYDGFYMDSDGDILEIVDELCFYHLYFTYPELDSQYNYNSWTPQDRGYASIEHLIRESDLEAI